MEKIDEKVYNHDTERFEIITWQKTGTEYLYECDNNHQIHHIVDTDHGLLARFLGDGFSQLFPNEKFGEMDEEEAMNFIHEKMY